MPATPPTQAMELKSTKERTPFPSKPRGFDQVCTGIWYLDSFFTDFREGPGRAAPPNLVKPLYILEISCFLVVPAAPLDYKQSATSHKKCPNAPQAPPKKIVNERLVLGGNQSGKGRGRPHWGLAQNLCYFLNTCGVWEGACCSPRGC